MFIRIALDDKIVMAIDTSLIDKMGIEWWVMVADMLVDELIEGETFFRYRGESKNIQADIVK